MWLVILSALALTRVVICGSLSTMRKWSYVNSLVYDSSRDCLAGMGRRYPDANS